MLLKTADDFVDTVCNVCAKRFFINAPDILTQKRGAQLCKAKFAAYYLASDIAAWDAAEVGRQLRKDRTTIVSGVKKAKLKMEKDTEYAAMIQKLKVQILGQIHPETAFSGECQRGLPEQQGEGSGPDSIA